MSNKTNYLNKELYTLIQEDTSIFEFLQNGTLDGVWYWDLENQENEWMSPRFWTTLGYDPNGKKHLASEWQDLIHPEDLQAALDNFKKHCADPNHPYDQVVRYNHKDGSTVWVRCRGIAIRDKAGKPVRMLGAHIDITPQKQAEESLRKREEQVLSVFRATPTGIGVVIDRVFKQVNEQLCEMTGYSKEELTGQNARMLYPSDEDYEYVGREKYEQIRGHGTGTVETRWKRKDGHIIDVLLSSTPMDLDDLLKGVTFTALDITERKLSEKALAKSEKRYRKLFDSSKDAIMTLKPPTWKFTSGNFAIINMFKVKDEKEFTSLCPWDVSPENQPDGQSSFEKANKMIQIAMEEGSNFFEWTHKRVNGEEFPATVLLTKVKLEDSTFLQATVRDITERKQAEEEKRKALEFVAEQSKHALIGQVTGKVAHDFNNVLMGIMGNAQLAIMDCDNEKIKKRLENINEFSERGRDITNSLISFSKDQEPKQTYFKFEDKIELVLKMLEKDLTDIEVSRNYKPGMHKLLADPGMIQDVLANLVQNSIHAMSKVENPILNLKAYSQDDKFYFKIEDNGCGIPKEHQDSVYTPSFTLKGSQDKTGSYKSGIKGSGYGMSNVKKYIIEKHKGDISLESEVGKGTKITIALRIIKDHLSSDEKKEVVKSQIFDKKRILLVEDEPAIADVQYQILTKEPFSHIVSMAANGQAAIDLFDRNKFDVVSLDYMLPGNINGLDVYNHIRRNDKDLPVMFISGNMEFLESMTKLKEKDPNLDHLSKPVDNLDYVNKVNELVGRSIK